MDANQARDLIETGRLSHFSVDVHERDGRLVVNDRIALRVKCDVSMPRDADIEVLAEDKTLLGVLCFTSVENDDHDNKSDFALAAYLTELDFADFSLSRPLRYDYFVVDKEQLDEYRRGYAQASAIWGGFVHIEGDDARLKRQVAVIEAVKGMQLPLAASEALCQRAILAAHPFERFLKHYHQLELIFDWYVARQISRLPNDLNGFDKIMSAYSSGDLARAKEVITTFCSDKAAIRQKIDGVKLFAATAESIFQEFGKSGNPLASIGSWQQWSGQIGDKDVFAVAAYWIFRVRCSIAHHRMGEYLIKDCDEDFVVSFAEPLLLEVVRQVLISHKLHALM